MSKIYKSEPSGTRYRGVDRSVAYNPQTAASSDKQLRDYKAAQAQDTQTKTSELVRRQKQENLELQAQQSAAKGSQQLAQNAERSTLAMDQLYDKNTLAGDQQHEKLKMGLEASHLQLSNSVNNARTGAIQSGVKGLLSFANSTVSYMGQQHRANEIQAAKDAQTNIENAELDAAGLGDTFGSANPIDPAAIEASENTNTIAQAQSQAINSATSDLAGSSNPTEQYAADRMRQSTMWKQLEPLRGQGYAAMGAYPAAIQQARAEGLIGPGAQGLVDAQKFTREFAKMTGIMGAPRELQLKFARSAAAANQNMVTAVTAEHSAQIKAANEATWAGNVSNIVDASNTQTVGAAFEAAYNETKHGNLGFNGVDSQAATVKTLNETLANLVSDGKTSEIQALRDHVSNKSTGRTLGDDYDQLFDAAVNKSRTQAISDFRLEANEQTIQMKESIQFFSDNPTPENRAQAIDTLRGIGTAEAMAEASRLADKGMTYDPQKRFELLEMRKQGVNINQDMLKDLATAGIISSDEFKEFQTSGPQQEAEKAVGTYVTSIKAGLKQSMMGKATATDLTPEVKSQLNIRHQSFVAELNDLVSAEVALNPAIAKDTSELSRIVEAKSAYLLNQPQYKLESVPGEGYRFAGAIDADRRLARITVAPGVQDFSNFEPEETFGTLNFPKSEMSATKDRFLTLDQLKSDVKAITGGGAASNRTRLIAKNLGLSSRAMVEAQLRVNGMPSISYMESEQSAPTLSSSGPISGDLNAASGMKALQGMGVPSKGAAYLAGNIQQESTWHGTREWGGVHNPTTGTMDGTNRNGGLVSWASWSNDSARLGQIERAYGRNISQISEGDQLKYMMKEMRTSYPQAYATFMNPNASDSALRRASYQYWGFGHEGARYQYANKLLSQGGL